MGGGATPDPLPASPKYDLNSKDVNRDFRVVFGGHSAGAQAGCPCVAGRRGSSAIDPPLDASFYFSDSLPSRRQPSAGLDEFEKVRRRVKMTLAHRFG